MSTVPNISIEDTINLLLENKIQESEKYSLAEIKAVEKNLQIKLPTP